LRCIRWVDLYFFEGDTLDDPEKLLQETCNFVRHIRCSTRRPRQTGGQGVDDTGAGERGSAAQSRRQAKNDHQAGHEGTAPAPFAGVSAAIRRFR